MYYQLPQKIQDLADKNYALLKENPRHPSLHFKKIDDLWSVRVSKQFRALGFEEPEGIVWFWIGSHQEYDEIWHWFSLIKSGKNYWAKVRETKKQI
jgi:hypothetical protein